MKCAERQSCVQHVVGAPQTTATTINSTGGCSPGHLAQLLTQDTLKAQDYACADSG